MKFMSHTRRLASFLAVVSLACSAQANADVPPAKVAVIDFERTLMESEPGKKVIAPLDALMKQKKAEAQVMEEELHKLRTKAAEMASTATEPQLARMQRQFNDKLDDLRRYEKDANTELDRVRRESLARFHALAQPVVQSVSKEQGLTMVFQKQSAGLVYVEPSADITAQVIQRLNALQTSPPTAPAAPAR